MVTNSFFSKSLLLLAAFACFSCTKDIQNLNPSSDEEGEVRTLFLGIQPQTKTSLTFGTSGVKLNWNEGDRIAVIKGESAYVYELKETNGDGTGKFEAVGDGVDLTGNTDDVAIVHISGDNLYTASIYHNSSNVNGEIGSMSQDGNGKMNHLSSKGCLLQRVLDTPPTSAEQLKGNLAPVNSILRFSIAAPAAGLEEGEYPTVFIVTVKSAQTSFINDIKVNSKGFDLSRRTESYNLINKMQILLNNIERWDSSNPLDVALNVVMDDGTLQSGDEYIFEVQTNLGNLYSVTKTIKNKPVAGKVYKISLDGLTLVDCSGFCKALRMEDVNPVSVKVFAEFNPYDEGTYCYGKTFWQSEYGGWIDVVDPETGEKVWGNIVQSGKSDGKGEGPFSGEGYLLVEDYGVACLKPGKTYKYRPWVSLRANDSVTYYGPWAEFTTSELTICTYKEVDLGTGLIWAGWNIGATKPEDVGGYYAWGETEEQKWLDNLNNYCKSTYKHCNYSSSAAPLNKYYSKDNLTKLDADDDVAAKNPDWGNGWRMPTKDEMNALYDKTTKYDMTYNDVSGMAFIGRNGEDGNYGSNNIFIPYGGYALNAGYVSKGSHYALWSSSLDEDTYSYYWKAYSFNNYCEGYPDFKTDFKLSGEDRVSGRNVRAVRDKVTE